MLQISKFTLALMMMGYADLVFEHGGRYGVLDYKSNALGARDADQIGSGTDGKTMSGRKEDQNCR